MKPAKYTVSQSQLTRSLRKELKPLSFKSGIMSEVLGGKRPAYGNVILAKNSNGVIIGWSVVTKAKGFLGLNPIVMVYVNHRYRKRGIARQLVETVLREFKPLYKKRKTNKKYRIPSKVKNLVYYDRIVELFIPAAKNAGFTAKII